MRTARQFVLWMISLAIFSPMAFAASGSLERRIVIVQSTDAGEKTDRHRFVRVVEQACAELHLDESAVPSIVFIRLSGDEAPAGGVPVRASMLVERSFLSVEQQHGAGQVRFLVWLVGKPDDRKVVVAVMHVLRQHFQLSLSDDDLLIAEQRVFRRLDASVDVQALLK